MMVWGPPVPKQESVVCRGHQWECWVYEDEITPGCALPHWLGSTARVNLICNDINIKVLGLAASVASIIAISAGKCIMHPGAIS